MSTEDTKYHIGDMFYRNYSGVKHLCILLSRDYSKIHKRFVWVSTMNPYYYCSRLGGGPCTSYYEEDIDGFEYIGSLSTVLLKRELEI